MSKKTCKDTDTKLMSLINSYHTLKIFKIMTVKKYWILQITYVNENVLSFIEQGLRVKITVTKKHLCFCYMKKYYIL